MPIDSPSAPDGVGLGPHGTRPWLLHLRDGALVSAVTVAITGWLFKVWEIPLRRPFAYQHDGLAQLAEIKAIIENGWYQFNPRVGYPVGFDHRDFPLGADNLQWLIVKAMGFISNDAVLVTNLYYLLSFVLVAITAYFVTRYLGVSRRISFVVAILYTFLPYHFIRGTSHLSLAAYFTVPISCLLTILVWRHAPPFFRDDGRRVRFDWKHRRTIWLAVACLAIASTGIYYASFCVALMGCAGLLRLVTERDWRALGSAVALSSIIAVGIAVNISPSLLYWRDHGKNLAVAQRTVAESDFYALRPIQMISPIPGYRISEVGKITDRILAAPNNSERTQFLGAVGSVGLLGLLIALFGVGAPAAETARRKLIRRLAALTGLAIVLGVTGGFEWIIGLAGFTQIRAWNRISVFIGFYALVAVGLGLDWLVRRSRAFPHKALAVSGVAIALVVVGVLDQTSSAIIGDSRDHRRGMELRRRVRAPDRTDPRPGRRGVPTAVPALPRGPAQRAAIRHGRLRPAAAATSIHTTCTGATAAPAVGPRTGKPRWWNSRRRRCSTPSPRSGSTACGSTPWATRTRRARSSTR